MPKHVIDHPHNEASALLAIRNSSFLESRGWDIGFWIVSDEKLLSDALAALGRGAEGGWEVVPVRTSPGNPSTSKTCEDCETLARAGSRVYVFGSQYGSKDGPLQPKRHFVARFNEALVDVSGRKGPSLELDVARRPFVLHRLVNDALREAQLELLPLGDKLRDALVPATIRDGEERDKAWKALLRPDDIAINVEGATFVDGGNLLLGLRYPVTRDGHPIVVEIEGIDRLFEKNAEPPLARAVTVLSNVGEAKRPAGIRELDSREGWVHAITGDLDAEMLAELDGAQKAPSQHWAFHRENGNPRVTATCLRGFGRNAQVEGLALAGGDAWYVHDDEKIRLETSPLQPPATAPPGPGTHPQVPPDR